MQQLEKIINLINENEERCNQIKDLVNEMLKFSEDKTVMLARQFHDAYEELAPSFGYETRPETRTFDPESPNGRLMTAVVERVLGKPVAKNEETTESKEFDVLKNLLKSDKWPEAVSRSKIANEDSEQDKKERADGISNTLIPVLHNKKFLDFGCGEGYVVKHNANRSSMSVGYDIKANSKSFAWEEVSEKMLLTTDFEKVREYGPYDIILIYDVLDHVENETIEQVLEKAKSVLDPEGIIRLRCHPWTSRHGGHAYREINKAFIHLVFNDNELKDLGLNLEFNQKITNPIKNYNDAISKVGLIKHSEVELETQEVEDFFEQNPLIKNRILQSLGLTEWTPQSPKHQLSQCFLDYTLKK